MTLTALGYALALIVAGIAWWRWRKEVRERRLAALAGTRRGLSLHEFVRQAEVDGTDAVLASAVYLTVQYRGKLGEHRLHPGDALSAYFDDGDAVADLGRALMVTLDRDMRDMDMDAVASEWRSIADMIDWFDGRGARRAGTSRPPYLRTVQ